VEVATQLATSAEPGDEVAIAVLADAAEVLGATDPAASAELAQQALALTSAHDPRRGPLVARRAISLFAAGLAEEAKRFADTVLRQALPPAQEAQVRLSIASMFALAPDARADNARQALALPGLPEDLRAWLRAIVLHNLVVAGRTDQAVADAAAARAAAEASPTAESRFAIELAESGLDYQLFRFSLALQRLDDAAWVPQKTSGPAWRGTSDAGCWSRSIVSVTPLRSPTMASRRPSGIGRTGRCTSSKRGR